MSTVCDDTDELPAKRPVGRPTVYRKRFCDIATKMCRGGATDQEIADRIGISTAMFYEWCADKPEFVEALALGKEQADARAERSLYHRAVGYSHDAVKIFNDRESGPVIVPYREHVPPDIGALALWLKNRKPDVWRDRKQIEHTGQLTLLQLVLASMGEIAVEELEAQVALPAPDNG